MWPVVLAGSWPSAFAWADFDAASSQIIGFLVAQALIDLFHSSLGKDEGNRTLRKSLLMKEYVLDAMRVLFEDVLSVFLIFWLTLMRLQRF